MKEYTGPIKYRFNDEKATQAAAVLLNCTRGQMKYLRLIKLLYFAERDSFEQFGRPITGDAFSSLKNGPVLSNVLTIIRKDRFVQSKVWDSHIETVAKSYTVKLVKDPGVGELCDADIKILKKAWQLRRRKTLSEIIQESHELPEWQDPGDTSIPIGIEDLLRGLGKTDKEIQEFAQAALQEQRDQQAFRALFGR